MRRILQRRERGWGLLGKLLNVPAGSQTVAVFQTFSDPSSFSGMLPPMIQIPASCATFDSMCSEGASDSDGS